MGDGSTTPSSGDIEAFEQKEDPGIDANTAGDVSPGDSASQTDTPAYVTEGDVTESFRINQSSDASNGKVDELYNEIGDISPSDAPSVKQFAEQAFVEGTQARRLTAGMTGREASITGSRDMVGGWKTLNKQSIIEREGLTDIDEIEGGSTDSFMERAKLAEEGDTAATEAFITNYNHNIGGNRKPTLENAHSQMALYAGLDAMGVETPRHVFDAENKQVIVEGASRPGYETTTAEAEELPQEHADKIDPEQLQDVLAANLLLGNPDCNAENLIVGEDGTVMSFDYDYSETFGQLHGDAAERAESWIDDAVTQINEVRGDEIDMDASDVADRVEELATQLDESGMVDRVVGAVAEYDEFFADESSDMYADTENPVDERQNSVAFRVYKHVTNWSTANDDIVVAGL